MKRLGDAIPGLKSGGTQCRQRGACSILTERGPKSKIHWNKWTTVKS